MKLRNTHTALWWTLCTLLFGNIGTSLAQSQTVSLPPYEDPEVCEINTEPAHATLTPFATAGQAMELGTESSRTQSLNGDWDFFMVLGKDNIPEGFQNDGYNTAGWKNLPVPSNWQRHGFGTPVFSNSQLHTEPDEVGLYRKRFSLPENWDGGRVILHFAGVKTAYHVYLNGKNIGYAEGAFLPSEFDLTDHLRPGENLLAVAVYRVAEVSDIENFDTWRLSGIFRDVNLMHRPATYIEDFEIKSPAVNNYLDGQWDINARIRHKGNKKAGKLSLFASLYDAQGNKIAEESAPVRFENGTEANVSLSQLLKNIKTWNAETPNLYRSVLELRDAKGKTLEAIGARTGFRTVAIIDSKICVNGKKILFKGVNRHDWDPDRARAVTREDVRLDLETMKRYNINSLRTSHYPQHTYVYELADELGLYIMDEAAQETHWKWNAEREKGWREPHVSRMSRMVERDKNHASVVMWSAGNEFYSGPHTDAMQRWAEQRDQSRLFYYEGRTVKGEEDGAVTKEKKVRNTAYRTPEQLKEIALGEDRPVVMKEYMHSSGNSMGQFDYEWDVIRSNKVLHGGFIWDWKDQGWRMNGIHGEYVDWGEDAGDAPQGLNGFDGVTNSYCGETPEMIEVAKVHQDVAVTAVNAKRGSFKVNNRHSFLPLSVYQVRWIAEKDGVEVQRGETTLNTLAGKTETFQIDLSKALAKTSEAEGLWVRFEFVQKQDIPGIPAGHVIAWDQIPVKSANHNVTIVASETATPYLRRDKYTNEVRVQANGNSFVFDERTGVLSSWKIGTSELIENNHGPAINLWRATLDSDRSGWGVKKETYLQPWDSLGLASATFTPAEVKTGKAKGSVFIEAKGEVKSLGGQHIATLSQRYTFFADGTVAIGTRFLPSEGTAKIAGLPRMGLAMDLNPAYRQAEWLGKGPHENYRDRASSARVGRYSKAVEELYTPYGYPQANGNRTGTRWLELRDHSGKGLRAELVSREAIKGHETLLPEGAKAKIVKEDGLFEFTASPYNEMELHTAKQTDDLPVSRKTVLSLDLEHAGLGGHPRPKRRESEEVKPVEKSFVFVLKPLKGN
ncbi:beta-galactosidase (plasmid) [Fulvitalea axinellae]|uniref:Beta-galactosidase n=1 Tax=Fulvitalea axinellae TaxID=1182444 RepID=A0AAU9CWP1_9BACT|nr:beta-galactosidase [Fulvitalea axinellae]